MRILAGMLPIQLKLIYIWYTVLLNANGVASAIKANTVPVQNLSIKLDIMATIINQVTAPGLSVVHSKPEPANTNDAAMKVFL